MKINVPIEISNDDLVALSNLIDAKVTKRRATRKDVAALCNQHIGGLIAMAKSHDLVVTLEPDPQFKHPTPTNLYRIDPEDQAVLAGKDPSYIRGWNQVKRSKS